MPREFGLYSEGKVRPLLALLLSLSLAGFVSAESRVNCCVGVHFLSQHRIDLLPTKQHCRCGTGVGAIGRRQLAITVRLAVPNMNQHAYAVDICDLQMTQLRSTHAGRVQSHQHGTVEQVAGRIDESDRFFLCQDHWQAARCSGIRHFLDRSFPSVSC